MLNMTIDMSPEAVLRRSNARAQMYRRRRVLYLAALLVAVILLDLLL